MATLSLAPPHRSNRIAVERPWASSPSMRANSATTGNDALTDELMGLCKKTLAPYKYPRWIEIVDSLPKTATGKIQRFKLRDGGAA